METTDQMESRAREILVPTGDFDALSRDALQLLAQIHAHRTRLAEQTHTHLGQKLTALNIELHVCTKRLNLISSCPPETREALEKIGGWVDDLLQFSKMLVAQLTPNVLMQIGFDAAAAWAIRLSNKRTGDKTELVLGGIDLNLPPIFAAYAFDLFADTLQDLETSSVSEIKLKLSPSPATIVASFAVARLAPDYEPAAAVRCRTILIGGTIRRSRKGKSSWIELEIPVRDLQPGD